ncbi:DUF6006 family protein [Variovorax sp. LjRoot290]|uniref:DUF6006 family protein n=1 Tax=Variovorax sp. LjRoot290 TaxID=3342316 RepID=UPI003ECC4777
MTSNTTRRSLTTFSRGLALCFALSGPALASTVGGWWGGAWNCSIDGRPARMTWVPVNDTQTSCDGDTCSSSAGARWKGKFSDNNSRWVALTHPESDGRGLRFRHADGNQWYLAKPSGNRTTGWTTWNHQRYPLSCWRS